MYRNNLRYEGEYNEGVKEGRGKVSYVDSGELIYEGGWRDGMPAGEGNGSIQADGKIKHTLSMESTY